MATPQTRANTKKADKTSSEKTPEKTKDHTTMSEVSRSLNLIHKDLAEVKAEMKKNNQRGKFRIPGFFYCIKNH